jgi:hypothetical protein
MSEAQSEVLNYFLEMYDVDMIGAPSPAKSWGFMPYPGHDFKPLVEAGMLAVNRITPQFVYITPLGGVEMGRDDIYVPFEFLEDESEKAK